MWSRKDQVIVLCLCSRFPFPRTLHELGVEDDVLFAALPILRYPATRIQSISVCKLRFWIDVDAPFHEIDIIPFCKCNFIVSESCIDQEMNQVFLLPRGFAQKQ